MFGCNWRGGPFMLSGWQRATGAPLVNNR